MKKFNKLLSVLLIIAVLLSIIPNTVYAISETPQMSEEFSTFLQDGKLVLNYAKPNSKDEWYAELICQHYEDEQFADEGPMYYLTLHDKNGVPGFSDDLSMISIGLWKSGEMEELERHTVDVVWNYDEKVYQKSQEILQKLPAGDSAESTFCLTDLEFVNYLTNVLPEYSWEVSMLDYSGDLKAITENTNFIFKMDVRSGGGTFYSETGGIVRMTHGDTTYSISTDLIKVRSNYVIYVPENTSNTKEALIAAAQKRVDDYIGKGVIHISDSGKTVSEYYEQERNRILSEIADIEQEITALEQQISELESIIEAEKANAPYHNEYLVTTSEEQILQYETLISWKLESIGYLNDEYDNAKPQEEHLINAVGGYIFNLTVNGREECYNFVIVKDDDKLSIPKYESVDVSTDASVSADSSEVPLDTVIKVEKITHGEEHERICGTLEIKDGEIYDIKLHSGSLDDYITELKNGKFKVRLPIKNEYKGKELVVYYVDANGNKTKYNVTVKNNFAFFETDHFSIYTLTTVSEDDQNPPITYNEGYFSYTVTNECATITGCDKEIGSEVIIPTTLGGYPVTGIADNVFAAFSNIERVYYCATEEEWNNILIGSGNEPLTKAKRNYHNYEWSIIMEYPTCSSEGEELFYCSICKHEELGSIAINPENHEFADDFTIDKEVTFFEDGSKSRHCTLCEEVTDVTTIPNKSYLLNAEYMVTVKKSLFAEEEYNIDYDINSDKNLDILDLICLKNILLK